jgi:hypothetical protein
LVAQLNVRNQELFRAMSGTAISGCPVRNSTCSGHFQVTNQDDGLAGAQPKHRRKSEIRFGIKEF